MASQPCDACDEEVPIGGGISGMWSSDPEGTGGMTLEFPDGREFFLCFDCIGDLPEEPDAADVDEVVER
jgi:hypothetical protein